MTVKLEKLLDGVTITGAGASSALAQRGAKSFQATVAGTGAVTATVKIQATNDQVSWLDIGTITLSGTTTASDGFASDAPWGYYRANVTAISGTSAAVTVTAGNVSWS